MGFLKFGLGVFRFFVFVWEWGFGRSFEFLVLGVIIYRGSLLYCIVVKRIFCVLVVLEKGSISFLRKFRISRKLLRLMDEESSSRNTMLAA